MNVSTGIAPSDPPLDLLRDASLFLDFDGTLVELETWPQLPNYLEIEGKSEEAVESTARLLELDWSEHIIQSNDYLYAKHWDVDRKVVFKKLAHLTFEG